jgi:hypothetical protein
VRVKRASVTLRRHLDAALCSAGTVDQQQCQFGTFPARILLAPQCGNSISQLRLCSDVGFICHLSFQCSQSIGKLCVPESHRCRKNFGAVEL